jgi:pyrophosphatase PpaX
VKLQGVIFDLDGTLGDTLPVCCEAYRRAFDEFLGRPFTDREIIALFGPTEEGIIQRLVPDRWQACLRTYLDTYEKVHVRYAQPFPGIEGALQLLRQRDVALAIVTGKGAHSAAISLRYLGLAHYFDAVETGSVEGAVKPLAIQKVVATWDVPLRQVAYVGDSAYDMEAAQEAGVIPLGAAWATTSDADSLNALIPLATFRSVESFIKWIDNNGEPTAGSA